MKTLVRRAATSLLTRILLVEGITILVACVAMPFAMRAVLESSARAIQQGALRQQADLVASHAAQGPDGSWSVALPHDELPVYASGYDGRAYALLDDSGHVLASSPFARPGSWPAALAGGGPGTGPRVFSTGPLVGLSEPHKVAGQRLHILVTQDQTRPGAVIDDVVRRFLAHYLVWLVGLLLLLPLANVAMLWPLVRRMRRSALEASRLNPQKPGARLDPSGLPAEAQALVSAINDLLGRVEASLDLQQEFAGNVAHELRTPLATLRLEAAKLPTGPAREVMLGQIERMAHVLAQLRDLAGLEHEASLAFDRLDLSELAVAVVAELTPAILAGGRGIALAGAEQPIPFLGNRGLLAMAMTNLIENARLHTPPGTMIEVLLDPSGRISVIDDGPGIAEENGARLIRRFWRADHRRSDGAGLGLSIVQRIMRLHHGQLYIRPTPRAGACFTLVFDTKSKP